MLRRVVRIGLLIAVFMGVAAISTFFTLSYLIRGTDRVVVPDVTEGHVVRALEVLSDLNLNTRVLRSEYSDTVPRHHVIFQEPEPGAELKVGRDVRIVISKGSPTLVTPNLKGMSVHQAAIILEQNDLCGGKGAEAHSSQLRMDLVMAQNPEPGITVARGTCVNLLISKGPRPAAYLMPDLLGLSLEEALTAIEQRHLSAGSISTRIDPRYKPDVIVDQDPPRGRRVSEKQTVQLSINRRSEPLSDPASGNTCKLVRYRLEYGFLKSHIKVLLNAYGTAITLYDDFLAPGNEIWFMVPHTEMDALLLFRDDERVPLTRMDQGFHFSVNGVSVREPQLLRNPEGTSNN